MQEFPKKRKIKWSKKVLSLRRWMLSLDVYKTNFMYTLSLEIMVHGDCCI